MNDLIKSDDISVTQCEASSSPDFGVEKGSNQCQSTGRSMQDELIAAFDKELCIEAEKARKIHSIDSARMNALIDAFSRYGQRANLQAIDAYFDGMKAMVDSGSVNCSDAISVSIDNALHSDDFVKIVLLNGSIRVLPKDVASVMLQCVEERAAGIQSDDILCEIRERALRLHFMINENVRRQMKPPCFDTMTASFMKQNSSNRQNARKLPSIASECLCFQSDTVVYDRELPSITNNPIVIQCPISKGKIVP